MGDGWEVLQIVREEAISYQEYNIGSFCNSKWEFKWELMET